MRGVDISIRRKQRDQIASVQTFFPLKNGGFVEGGGCKPCLKM